MLSPYIIPPGSFIVTIGAGGGILWVLWSLDPGRQVWPPVKRDAQASCAHTAPWYLVGFDRRVLPLPTVNADDTAVRVSDDRDLDSVGTIDADRHQFHPLHRHPGGDLFTHRCRQNFSSAHLIRSSIIARKAIADMDQGNFQVGGRFF